jgi:hypothetical protein
LVTFAVQPGELAAGFFLGLGAELLPLTIGERHRAAPCAVVIGANRAFAVPPSLAWHAISLKVAVFHKFNHGLSSAVCAVPKRLSTAICRAALVGCEFHASPTAIAAGRAVRANVLFFQLAHHAVDDHRRFIVVHCCAPSGSEVMSATFSVGMM